jgi:hypothetical protein
MTINVGVASPDGIVLASNSRTTRMYGEHHRVLSDSSQKVFAIDNRFGVATSGFAFIEDDTIAGVMDRFLAQLEERDTRDIDAFANALGSFFDASFTAWLAKEEETWDPAEQGAALRFLVSGYDDRGVGHLHEVTLPVPDREDSLADTIKGGAVWRGQTDVIGRLIKGVDWIELLSSGPDLTEELQEFLGLLEYSGLEPITVQDALDYAELLVRTTIDMQRFSDGTFAHPGLVPGCGGPVQLLVIERRGALWKKPPPGLVSLTV